MVVGLGLAACAHKPTALPTPIPSPPHAPAKAQHTPVNQASAPVLPTPITTALPSVAGLWLPVPFDSLPQWSNTDLGALRAVLLAHCQHISKRPTLITWQPFCAAIHLSEDPKHTILAHLNAYRQTDVMQQDTGLATGYYEPIVQGSLSRNADFQWPLFSLPPTGTQLSRAQLTPSDGSIHPVLTNQVLVWLNNPIDAYVIQVQGSGRVSLGQGETVRLAFAGTNQQPFSSIANPLIQTGVFKATEASNDKLKQWALTQSPNAIQTLLNSNARMVFFKRDASPDAIGPVGSLGIPLTAKHSIAVDPSFTPLGSLVWLDTPVLEKPQLMLAQDTGSAIKGAARVDIYFGTGDSAGALASKTKHPTRVWVLWPKP